MDHTNEVRSEVITVLIDKLRNHCQDKLQDSLELLFVIPTSAQQVFQLKKNYRNWLKAICALLLCQLADCFLLAKSCKQNNNQ